MKKTELAYFNIKAILSALLLGPLAVAAAEISIVGLFSGKAVVVVDDGKPRTLSIGQTSPEGIKLLAADSSAAVIEYQGRRQTLPLASGWRIRGPSLSAPSSASSVTLTADAQGHYQTLGQVNGGTVQFLVDTGATSIALPSAEARRLGINYLNGERGYTQTANGRARAYKIKLDTVKVGDITLHAVDAVVLEGDGLKIALLGMSFLNRTDMKRDGQALTLIRRF
ncbi:MAG: TIGR02281 family clan AA aspartic protease [Betaproteobacteria bacterium]|nr:TIGR02281 family clan AA aspartic protease [Betaproteobacteria bacterium]MDH4293210.1 TIGR02281 family clan AA aspartic protease [Betaproteobacteria bacterium]MDH5342248.1 TIGR02281 family clan AA aspartic protease [Betaproteobacteria bacterium]